MRITKTDNNIISFQSKFSVKDKPKLITDGNNICHAVNTQSPLEQMNNPNNSKRSFFDYIKSFFRRKQKLENTKANKTEEQHISDLPIYEKTQKDSEDDFEFMPGLFNEFFPPIKEDF